MKVSKQHPIISMGNECRIASSIIIRKENFGGILYNTHTQDKYQINDIAFSFLSYIIKESGSIISNEVIKKFDDISLEKLINDLKNIDALSNVPSRDFPKVFNRKNLPQKILSSPIYIEYYPLWNCQHKCDFCLVWDEIRSCKSLNNDELYNRVGYEVLNQSSKNGVFEITLLGGEPLLMRGLFEFLDEAKNKNITINISTNAKLLDKFLVDKLSCYKNLNIQLSLHSYDPSIHDRLVHKKGSHKKVMKSIDLLMNAGMDFRISSVLTKINKYDMPNIADIIYKYKPVSYNLLFMHETNPGHKNISINWFEYWQTYEEIVYILNNYGMDHILTPQIPFSFLYFDTSIPNNELENYLFKTCKAGNTKLTIFPNGEIYSCELLKNKKGNKSINILNDNFIDAWNEIAFNRNLFDDTRTKSDYCKICKYNVTCKGGCPFYFKNNIDSRCPLNKKIYLKNSTLIAKNDKKKLYIIMKVQVYILATVL